MASPVRAALRVERQREGRRFLTASAAAACVGASAAALLGVSGWFLAGCATAAAGAALAFNAILPSAAIRLLAILRTGGRYVERLTGHDAALRVLARLRPALFRALAARPASEACAISGGEAVARLVQDVDEVEQHLLAPQAFAGLAASCAASIGLCARAGAAGAAACVLAVAACAVLLLARRTDRIARAVPVANGALRDVFLCFAAAAPELRAYGLEGWAADRIAERGDGLIAAQTRVTRRDGTAAALLIGTGGTACVAVLLAAAGSRPIIALAALAAAAATEGAAGALRLLMRRGRRDAAMRRLDALSGDPGRAEPGAAPSAPAAIELAGRVLGAGTLIGIAGPSGCGKTTLVERLLRLRETSPGIARLGGVDLASVAPAASRGMFAWAAADAALLSGTIRENLLLGRPGASDGELWRALHMAALDGVVRAFPQHLDTWVGNAGERLSGGERRRLALARALLSEAPWLLLDEPTENLDPATEALVVALLESHLRATGRGAIVVSHRRLVLDACTQVLELPALVWRPGARSGLRSGTAGAFSPELRVLKP